MRTVDPTAPSTPLNACERVTEEAGPSPQRVQRRGARAPCEQPDTHPSEEREGSRAAIGKVAEYGKWKWGTGTSRVQCGSRGRHLDVSLYKAFPEYAGGALTGSIGQEAVGTRGYMHAEAHTTGHHTWEGAVILCTPRGGGTRPCLSMR